MLAQSVEQLCPRDAEPGWIGTEQQRRSDAGGWRSFLGCLTLSALWFGLSLRPVRSPTLLKQDSHSRASSFCRSCTRSARCRYVSACIRTWRRASQHRQAIPESKSRVWCSAGFNVTCPTLHPSPGLPCNKGHQQWAQRVRESASIFWPPDSRWRCSSAQEL